MMSLSLFFDPIPDELVPSVMDTKALYWMMDVYLHTFPKTKGKKFVLIGVPYNIEELENPDYSSANAVRYELYRLARTALPCDIIDLGNLRIGHNSEETLKRLAEVIDYFSKEQTLVINIGGQQVYTLAQVRGCHYEKEGLRLAIIDAKSDMDEHPFASLNERWLNHLLVHNTESVHEASLVGYQAHLCHPEHIDILKNMAFSMLRLGLIKEDTLNAEPIMRNADILSMDVSSIHAADLPAQSNKKPFGLSATEACQLCWYAGYAPFLNSAGFYGYQANLDSDGYSAQALATIIWYLIEARLYRVDDAIFENTSHYYEFVVRLSEDQTISFLKSKISSRWWFKAHNASNPLQRLDVIACNEEIYDAACNGEIPLEYLMALERKSDNNSSFIPNNPN